MPRPDHPLVRFSRGGLRAECVRGFEELPLETLPWSDGAALRRFGEVVKMGPTTVLRLRHRGETLYVKRFLFTDPRRRLRGALGWSRARSEWNALRAVRGLGIATAVPLLVGVRRLGALRHESYLVTRGIEGAEPADAVVGRLAGAERRRAFVLLGRLVTELHRRGVFHDDLKAAHIRLQGGRLPERNLAGVTLLDLYRCVTGRPPSLRRRGVNLAQVWISLPGARRSDQARLLRGALGPDAGRRERRRLWRAMQVALARRRRRRARRG